ncbi:hypothetical protein [Polyangium fumosum]|uniref:Uncharacterized protein n=1 Tax=Polyangium fumosum TaxID=889272 RepID=A0A4U1J988_9BACT|nr:hypothetical protein [Polyangium fumosum]TKD04341.1 hypothetical protein E8A74_23550 [Polyangium fumosum]
MASDDERFEELVAGIVAPLVLGGKLRLARPFGQAGTKLGEGRRIVDADLRARIDVARVRRARLLAPVDTLPDLDEHEWALAAALNDVLQVTNHELGGLFTKGRYMRLLRSVFELCGHVPPPRDVGAALARHATFARVMELNRADTSVRWWTGSASFRGVPPPKRLLMWQGLRRVHVETQRVPLHEMCDGLPSAVAEGYQAVLGVWLSRSPLTDLGSITRAAPVFAWSPASIALVAVPAGRMLAFRVLARQRAEHVSAVLEKARAALDGGLAAHRAVVEEFSREVVSAFEAMHAKPEKRAGSGASSSPRT